MSIKTKEELKNFLIQDAAANRRTSIKSKLFGDRIWKFIVSLRHLELYSNYSGFKRFVNFPMTIFYECRYSRLSLVLGFSIPKNVFDKGLSLAHIGTIVVNDHAIIGENCRIHQGVTIGTTNGSSKAPRIGNNCFIASGAVIIGDVFIADDVAIGANAVVVKSILEEGTTWGGVPAKKISNHNSHSNLSPMLKL